MYAYRLVLLIGNFQTFFCKMHTLANSLDLLVTQNTHIHTIIILLLLLVGGEAVDEKV